MNKIFYVKEEGTPFLTAMIALFSNSLTSNKKLFNSISTIDILIAKTFGQIIPALSAGEIQILAEL